MSFRPNETVHCRFAPVIGPFTVVSCDGCVAVLRDNSDGGRLIALPVGELTRVVR